MPPSFRWKGRYSSSEGRRESDGAKGGEIKGLSRKERPVFQGRPSFSIERNRSKKI
jgi:hypothetical protein